MSHSRANLGIYEEAVNKRLSDWEDKKIIQKIWAKDPVVWIKDEEKARDTGELVNRLGWLSLPAEISKEIIDELKDFSDKVRADGFKYIVVLGMGGSSIAPKVFRDIHGYDKDYPELIVLDSTHPDAIRNIENSIDLIKTLFIVSSKSGTTIETISFLKYFYDKCSKISEKPGDKFISITDEGTELERLSKELGFKRIFISNPDVGGRFSVFTYFGLVPAVFIGCELDKLGTKAYAAMALSKPEIPVDRNPGATIGIIMAEMALAGIDKITFIMSPGIASFGKWLEQLLAESTGKNGTGLVPIICENPSSLIDSSKDRFFFYLRMKGENNKTLDEAFDELIERNRLFFKISMEEKCDIGAAFYLWEMATACAGAVLGINPFDQPDVGLSKKLTNDLIKIYLQEGAIRKNKPNMTDSTIDIYTNVEADEDIKKCFNGFLSKAGNNSYFAIMGYLPPSEKSDTLLLELREKISSRTGKPVISGYGPSYLHSIGQLYKGGKNDGLFIMITMDFEQDVSIPGEEYSFGILCNAQASGDYQALVKKDRKVIRFHIHGDFHAGLEKIKLYIDI